MNIFVDIETIPGATPPEPSEIKAPSNYKDEVKMRAYQEAAVEEEWRKEALLSHRGRVLCLGLAVEAADPVSFTVGIDAEDEKGVLSLFWDYLKAEKAAFFRWIGFNLRPFDLNWIRHRAYKYQIEGLAGVVPWQRYDKACVDVREIWNGADYQGRGKLDEIVSFLGVGNGKPLLPCPICSEGGVVVVCSICGGEGVFKMDGSKVFDLWRAGKLEEIASYCRGDVADVRAVFKRLNEWE